MIMQSYPHKPVFSITYGQEKTLTKVNVKMKRMWKELLRIMRSVTRLSVSGVNQLHKGVMLLTFIKTISCRNTMFVATQDSSFV